MKRSIPMPDDYDLVILPHGDGYYWSARDGQGCALIGSGHKQTFDEALAAAKAAADGERTAS